jgi:hypothetical protein
MRTTQDSRLLSKSQISKIKDEGVKRRKRQKLEEEGTDMKTESGMKVCQKKLWLIMHMHTHNF